MAKLTDITKIAEKALNEMTSKKNLRIVGEEAKSLIQKRTRLGGSVKQNLGTRSRLKPLSEDYKKTRKRKRSDLDRTTSPARSNLTYSGQMLREIGVKIRNGSILLRFIHPFAKQKAKWVQDQGREFFFISKPEFRQLQNLMRKRVSKVLNKFN